MPEGYWWARYGNFAVGEGAYPHMGQVIAHYRKKRGWTQESLAIALGVSKKTVEDLEGPKGMNGPDLERRKTLVKLLGIPPALLALDWRIQTLAGLSNTSDEIEQNRALLEEDAFTLYKQILVLGWGCLSNGRGDILHTHSIDACLPTLQRITRKTPEKEPWLELLCNFYQISMRVAQHSMKPERAVADANEAVKLANSIESVELQASALYRRSVMYLEQSSSFADAVQQKLCIKYAKDDIDAALTLCERVRPKLKGNIYLLASEIYLLGAGSEEQPRTKFEKWHEKTANLVYRGKLEDEGNFLKLNISALHHEKAKMLLRCGRLKEARGELNLTWKTLPDDLLNWKMNTYLTEADLFTAEHDLEGSVHSAISAYNIARPMRSIKGENNVQRSMLSYMSWTKTIPMSAI